MIMPPRRSESEKIPRSQRIVGQRSCETEFDIFCSCVKLRTNFFLSLMFLMHELLDLKLLLKFRIIHRCTCVDNTKICSSIMRSRIIVKCITLISPFSLMRRMSIIRQRYREKVIPLLFDYSCIID